MLSPYDFGVVKLFGEYSNNKMETSFATNTFNPFGNTKPGFNGVLIGATIPVSGYDLIRLSYFAVRYASLLGACQREALAQRVEQHDAGVELERLRHTVDPEAELHDVLRPHGR